MNRPKLSVVKVGGNVIDDEAKLDAFLSEFAKLPEHKILVHGGGKIATNLAAKLGIETTMVDGRRITTEDMLDVVVMSYAGLVNKKIVAKLQGAAIQAIGMCGADANVILSARRKPVNGVDFGYVGDPVQVRDELLTKLLEANEVPVLVPITHDGAGSLLNTNADTIASEVAKAMSKEFAVSLKYCFELSGVLRDINDPDSLVRDLNMARYGELKQEKAIHDGMIPKLDNAFAAIDQGVSEVHILNFRDVANTSKEDFDAFTCVRK